LLDRSPPESCAARLPVSRNVERGDDRRKKHLQFSCKPLDRDGKPRRAVFLVRRKSFSPPTKAVVLVLITPTLPWPIASQPTCAVHPFASPPPTVHAVRCVNHDEPIAPGVKQPLTGRPPRFEVPADLPGAQAPAINLPRLDAAIIADFFLMRIFAGTLDAVRPGCHGYRLQCGRAQS
jgi:hypothetical protein